MKTYRSTEDELATSAVDAYSLKDSDYSDSECYFYGKGTYAKRETPKPAPEKWVAIKREVRPERDFSDFTL